MGDGFMALFDSATGAIDSAIALQQSLAARVSARAEGGEILTTDVARQLVAGKGYLFADRGVEALKGFDEPVLLYSVRWSVDD